MSTTENPEEPEVGKGPTEILSAVKVVLKSASNLCNEGDEATVKSAKVCFRVGESLIRVSFTIDNICSHSCHQVHLS